MVGAGLTIINSGTITGGVSGGGVTRANAISFTGGASTLSLQSGWGLTGGIDVVGSLDFAQAMDATLANVILGSGSVSKSGTGTLTLTGNNTCTGATTVNAGTLEVDGTIVTSAVTVNAGGVLAGAGIVDRMTTTIMNGGTLAPGSGTPRSSLTINGNLAFASGALYLVHVSPSAASFATVTGTATLGGATVNAVFTNGSYVAKQYTILTAAGGVSGTFAPGLVNTNRPAGFQASLSYDTNDVFLNLRASLGNGASQSQSAERCRQREQLFQQSRRAASGVPVPVRIARRRACQRTDPSLRRTRPLRAADHVRCDEPVHEPAHRSLHGARWRSRRSVRHARVCG